MTGQAGFNRQINIFLHCRRELLLLFLILCLIGLGTFENNFQSQTAPKDIWVKKGAVKGVATSEKQIREHFRIIKVEAVKSATKPREAAQDEIITPAPMENQIAANVSASSLIAAINSHRAKKGVGALAFDSNLSGFAQGRSDYFASRGAMDSHAGFEDFINNQNGFAKLGFFAVGENSSFGYQVTPSELIEDIFANHLPHENNQINPEWTHVGVGVTGVAVDIVFAGRKQ